VGFDEFNISLDRLQFSKVDNGDFDPTTRQPVDLRVDLLNEQGVSEGSVTIGGQGVPINRVETLEIYHDENRTQRISLVNLFSQLAVNEPTMFTVEPGSDALGSLVSPA